MGITWGHLNHSQLTAVPLRVVVLDDLKQLLVEDDNVSFPNLEAKGPESHNLLLLPSAIIFQFLDFIINPSLMSQMSWQLAWTRVHQGKRAASSPAQSDKEKREGSGVNTLTDK
jgi:hypothetical protein